MSGRLREKRSRREIAWFASLLLLFCAAQSSASTSETSGSTQQASAANSPQSSQKRALLVGISVYPSNSDWPAIHGEQDLPLVAEALVGHGFEKESIRILKGPQATRKGILRAIEKHLLEPANPGDVLFFHFSGHGQRLADQSDGDELDGFDEALVTWGNRRHQKRGLSRKSHIRDDELGEMLTRLRRRVGSSGNVVMVLDSCFSGTATRISTPARGVGALPSGKHEVGTGLDKQPAGAKDLAPYAVLSAASSHQSTWEVVVPGGATVGALSWALARSLASPSLTRTYRDLFDDIRWQMAAMYGSEPVAEGDLDTELFAGRAVRQAAALRIELIKKEGLEIVVRPGALVGLEKGAELEVHAPGTLEPTTDTYLVRGVVKENSPIEAIVRLEAALEIPEALACRVFVTRYSFGDLRLSIQFSTPAGTPRPPLPPSSVFEWVEEGGDIVVQAIELGAQKRKAQVTSPMADREIQWRIQNARSGEHLTELPPSSVHPVRELHDYLWSLVRNRYLRGIQLPYGKLHADFELVPVGPEEAQAPDFPRDICSSIPRSRGHQAGDGEVLELPAGSCYRVRLRPSQHSAYYTLLDLRSDGGIGVLWPEQGRSPEFVAKGKESWLGDYYRTRAPSGLDQLLLVASRRPLNFHPFLWPEPGDVRSVDSSELGPFEPLFGSLNSSARSQRVRFVRDELSTASRFLRVLPAVANSSP